MSTPTRPELRIVPPPDPATGPGSVAVPVTQWQDGRALQRREPVAEEVPVALVYNGISHAVMMATPNNLEDFGLGFSLSEGIIRTRNELFDIEVEPVAQGIEVRMTIAAEAFALLKQRRRNLTGRTGCGLCGTESLSEAVCQPRPVQSELRVRAAAVHAAIESLRRQQTLHEATGATHAAGWADADGRVSMVREDVGRHNALDKLIGALARAGQALDDGFVVLTSRASYEMVQKSAAAGIALVAAVSAPTSLAIRLAEEAGVTLAGFVRPGRHTVYSHPQRIA